ncbi:MAG: endonuclease [Lachnospiraceae bacterium]|nr:endonuclease [Lachnospiraceae bacterium]
MRILKKLLKTMLIIVLAVIVLAGGFLGYLTITEYSPDPVEKAEIIENSTGKKLARGEDFTIVSWNIGYGALGKYSDFIMDGGGNAPDADEKQVRAYLEGIKTTIEAENANIYMLQEVDSNSSRSHGIDERSFFSKNENCFALNYSCPFVPYPWPPIGKVHSGLYTASDYEMTAADRISLPCPFSWPLRIANLKRCLMVSRYPLADTDAQLVLVNLHLEAYTEPEGRKAQMEQFLGFIEEEYKKGNYVIAGGDFNQCFPGSLDKYPNTHEDLWTPGIVEESEIPEGFALAYDMTTPTCRLLNQPYDPADTENTQYYVIDGFILSPNVQLNGVKTIDAAFENTDHNPVRLDVTLK